MMNRANILVIDDEQLDRYLLTRDLKRGGVDASIVEFSSGVDALEFLKDFRVHEASQPDGFPPRIIFLDINMPKLSGFEFLEKFEELRQEYDGYGQCSVMMMTSSNLPEERERALGHESVVEFMTKGQIGAEGVSAKVEAVLSS